MQTELKSPSSADSPDPHDPAVARRNYKLVAALLVVVAAVLYLTYLQRRVLFHALFQVG